MTIGTLADLLERRLQIIADHSLRDRNPNAHLSQLKAVSEAIAEAHASLRGQIDPRLNHYLSQASYSKALDHIRAGKQNEEGAK